MPKNLGGHVNLAELPRGTLLSNFKSVALTVFDLLAYNAQKFRRSRDSVTPPFGKIFLRVMSGLSLGRLLSNLKSVALTVFMLLAFNSHDRPLRTHKHTQKQTDRQTHIERTHYLRHSLRSVGGDNYHLGIDYPGWYVWISVEYSWISKFCEIVQQHIWGEVANFIPSSSAVYRRMQEWKNY